MNTPQSINNRLLRLYPVHYIKENFNSEQRIQSEIVNDIIARFNDQAISEFVFNHVNITKQSIYVYNTANVYRHRNNVIADELGLEITSQQLVDGVLTLGGYHSIVVEIRILDENRNYQELNLIIKQPYQVIVKGNYIVIKLTKVESNLRAYLGNTVEVLKSKKLSDDSDAINSILTYFDQNHHVRPGKADLNRGVKHLWENDIIDSREVAYRKDSSRATEIMDENSLYKEIYPEAYIETMRNPLENCTFRYLGEDENFPEHFICDATNGTLSFNIYPKNLNQINAVIDEIIRNN
ncbi:hypothetical protein BWD42_04285 [Sphingobacterium sp. CZ-UAM]|uniref:hypothetical protein n=1 Tax=Sphingobacterium sp. CZ-UAM TaxID=1933868 RepID=UPI0009861616|nr:hypothetical protein [Sphingobacterium sp. CZ-UAM]OOG19173.1 hypothetical protein BWD42_04285 [Sphingobacterium sp. CZ-UAM]